MNRQKTSIQEEVHRLAEKAFHQKLISGYGEGEHSYEYQIVYQGKPRHFSLEYARAFLKSLILFNTLKEHTAS
ncbi:MAG TPA: hypothetical protein V6C78_25500 [Crinalium sp.]|jgi:hypothetical protein